MWSVDRRPARRLLLALALTAACSGPAPPPPALARAEKLEHAGDDRAALAAYREAVTACGTHCAAAWAGLAGTLERTGDLRGAADLEERLGAEDPAALVRAGRLRLALGEDDHAYRLWWRAVTDHPDSAAADEALRHLGDDGGRRAPRELYGVLLALYPRLAGREIGDNLLYLAATLATETLGDEAAALPLLDRLCAAHPKSTLWDDAMWQAGGIARRRKDAEGALRRYRALTARREVALLTGSYFSPWMDEAQLEIGRVLRDDLGRPGDALRELGRVGRDYPDSTLRDDALWEMARTFEQVRDPAAACRTLAQLAGKFPESRWQLSEAPALREKLGCRS